MSIASVISSIETNVSNAYTSIGTKGGTIPANKNIANLADAIDSIPTQTSTKKVAHPVVRDVVWSTISFSGTLLPTASSRRGERVWSDGTHIYHSYQTSHYVFSYTDGSQKITCTKITSTGLTSFNGQNVWTDGTHIFNSVSSTSYKLDSSSDSSLVWVLQQWNINVLAYSVIWTDGTDIYLSYNTDHYKLNKSTSTWESQTWTGLTSFRGDQIFMDNEGGVYCRVDGTSIYQLSGTTWSLFTNDIGYSSTDTIWTDGNNVYHSYGEDYIWVFDTTSGNKVFMPIRDVFYGEPSTFYGSCVFHIGDTIFYLRSSTLKRLTTSSKLSIKT